MNTRSWTKPRHSITVRPSGLVNSGAAASDELLEDESESSPVADGAAASGFGLRFLAFVADS